MQMNDLDDSFVSTESLHPESIWQKYDRAFLITYSVQYFNGGLKFLFLLSTQDLLKNYYGMQPGQTQIMTTLIMTPWIVKVLWGIVSDTVPIMGSRKKSWLVVMGVL